MATKQVLHSSDSTGLSNLALFPPKISLSSPLLAFEIVLPPRPVITTWVYRANNQAEQLQDLDAARRRLVRENKALPVIGSLFPCIRIAHDSSVLYVFAIHSLDDPSQAQSVNAAIHLDGLSCIETTRFSPEWLYACSTECSVLAEPCPACPLQKETAQSTSSWSSACLLPREPFRQHHAQFIHALRDRLIEDISLATPTSPHNLNSRRAVRLKRGFLLGPPHATSGEWSAGWDHHARQRPLVYCELKLHLYRTRILVHPVMHSTTLVPLPISSPAPIIAGTPISLLPYGVPAYYLSTYCGPTGSLTNQFDAALYGLGVGEWKTLFHSRETPYHPQRTTYSNNRNVVPPKYIIAWLAVQNRHGEDKGMPIVWPSSLCVLPLPSFVHSRLPLKSLPTLPVQLLSSPPAAAAAPPPIRLPLSSLSPVTTLSEPPSPSALHGGHLSAASEHFSSIPQDERNAAEISRTARLLLMTRLSASDSLRAFRALTIASSHAKGVALEVSSYVDAVAKERDKERERLKRERDGSGSVRSLSSFIKHEKSSTSIAALSLTPSPRKVLSDEPPAAKQDSEDISLFALTEAYRSDVAQPPKPDEQATDMRPDNQVAALLPAAGITRSSSSSVMQVDLHPIKPESDPPSTAPASADTSSGSYDPFSGFDSNWHQQGNDFMGINLDSYDMGMPYSLGMNGTSASGDGGGAFNLDDDFGVFTDDDFSFFDGPSTSTRATAPTPLVMSTSGPLAMSQATPVDIQTSGPGPPSALSQMHPMPWLNQALSDGFTPKSMDAPTPTFPPAPDLIPSTPTQTPPSHSAPVTPSVMLADQLQSIHIRRSSISSNGSSVFDPIPFAQNHKAADGKYALGKFALPTPPADEERTTFLPPSGVSSSRSPGLSWQSTYAAATDPRVGIVRRLAGAKRKRLSSDHHGREGHQSPLWVREHEEWAISSVPEQDDSEGDELMSDSEYEDEEDAMDEDQSMRSVSRAHTPPPTFLPLGPTLLQTQFHHDLLLPKSVSLRQSDADTDVTMGMSAPMSAPTPVSPAAILGAHSERSKALEGAAQVLIREVVENRVWGDCWRASVVAALGLTKNTSDVWAGDVRAASELISSVAGFHSPLDVGHTFDSDAVVGLQPPLFAVANSEGIIQVLPPALRFWEKMGLSPRAGVKNVTAFIFYEGDERESEMVEWLDKLAAVYSAKNFGSHVRGRTAGCARDGLVPLEFDAFRKTFVSFVSALPHRDVPVVLYIVTPPRIMNLASSLLREVLSAVKKVRKTDPDAPILTHLVPESLISGALHDSNLPYGGLEIMAEAVYDRAFVPVGRTASRWLYKDGTKARAFAEPAYALASVTQKKVTFSLEAHPRSLDVFDRDYMLHVAYRASDCGKWLFAACIDQRGEAHDLKAWLIAEDSPEHFIVTNVWDFIMNVVTKANLEWRVVIARLGAIGVAETDAWNLRLESAMQENQHLPPLHVSLLVAEYEDSWTFIAPDVGRAHKTPTSPNRVPKHSNGLIFVDVSSTTYVLHPKDPMAISSSSEHSQETTYVPDTEDEGSPCELHIRPLHTTALVRVPAGSDYTPISMLRLNLLHSVHPAHSSNPPSDMATLEETTQNYFELSVLTKCRWKLNANPILPFHLAALEVMASALSRSDAVVESM